jgi:septum site-determining protein MinC
MDFSAVSIRGRGEGLTVEIGEGKWEELVAMLALRLDHSGGFFRHAHVAVELGARALNEQELKSLSDLLARHEIAPGIVRTSSDRTFHSAIAIGLAVIHESPEGSTLAAAQVAASNAEQQGYYVYRGSLRSGQVLERSDHVVVVGDVNPGAQVVSHGDILVWGRLRGTAHAGAGGNTQSVIAALDLDPIQLRIDTVIAATPGGGGDNRPRWQGGRAAARRPEIARLVDHQLVIDDWDEAKVHGANILKRRRD